MKQTNVMTQAETLETIINIGAVELDGTDISAEREFTIDLDPFEGSSTLLLENQAYSTHQCYKTEQGTHVLLASDRLRILFSSIPATIYYKEA